MTSQQQVKTLLTETETAWLAALEARRIAVAKEREYREALWAWIAKEKEAQNAERTDADP